MPADNITLANFLNFFTSEQGVYLLAWLIAMIVVLLITWWWPTIRRVGLWGLFAIALIALIISAFVLESAAPTYFALITTLIAAVMLKAYFPE